VEPETTRVMSMERRPGNDDGERPDLARLAGPAVAEAFGRLFDEHAGGLRRFLASRVGASTADDVVAETFLAALRDRGRYRPERATVRAWLYGIAANLMGHHIRGEVRALRATARLVRRAELGEDHAEQVSERLDAQRRVRQLAAALAGLAPQDREVLLLTSWAGLNATEVGEALDIPAGTVRSRLHRVRRWLRANAPSIDPMTIEDGKDE
jgi:RNA polymerase sigma-70 factor, ECF subfamily